MPAMPRWPARGPPAGLSGLLRRRPRRPTTRPGTTSGTSRRPARRAPTGHADAAGWLAALPAASGGTAVPEAPGARLPACRSVGRPATPCCAGTWPRSGLPGRRLPAPDPVVSPAQGGAPAAAAGRHAPLRRLDSSSSEATVIESGSSAARPVRRNHSARVARRRRQLGRAGPLRPTPTGVRPVGGARRGSAASGSFGPGPNQGSGSAPLRQRRWLPAITTLPDPGSAATRPCRPRRAHQTTTSSPVHIGIGSI